MQVSKMTLPMTHERHFLLLSSVCFAVIELSAEIATLQVQILNSKQELKRRFQEKEEKRIKKEETTGC